MKQPRSTPLRHRISIGIYSLVFYLLAFFSKRLVGVFGRWWQKQNNLHPNWFAQGKARTTARTQVGLISCDPRDTIERQLLLNGTWEPLITKTISNILRPGDVFVDVGAHIGYYSLLASRLVGSKGLVLAFEPLPENQEQILRNVRTNGFNNVLLFSVGVSDRLGLTTLYTHETGDLAVTSMRKVGDRAITIATCPIDSVLSAEVLRRVRLAKIDVEGAEWMVLQGMTSLLTQDPQPYVICEVTDQFLQETGASANRLMSYMRDLEYQILISGTETDDKWTELSNGAACPSRQVNVLFVPPHSSPGLLA